MGSEEKVTVVCRCEEITLNEIRSWIDKGYESFNELKRVLRVGMGPCQGRGCQDIILRELATKTGHPIEEIRPPSVRPTVKPIPIHLLATGGEE
jgi:bacterioferritin-associated ferredoxin